MLIQSPKISWCMRTKGTNGALREIVGSVVGASHSVRSRTIAVGVAVAVSIGIAVASIPTTVVILCSSICCVSSVGIGVGANFFDDLVVLLQEFINLRLILVDLGLLFPDDLQQIVILSRHLLYAIFVGSCRYRYFAQIIC